MAGFDPFSLAVASTVLQAGGSIMQGNAANESAQFQAAQLDQQAGQERASSQRSAMEEQRQARLALSRLQNNAGGGGGDATAVKLAGDIAGEGEYRALTALYNGEERARGMETSAGARRYEGKQAQTASYLKAAGTIFSDVPSLYDKYGKGGAYDYTGDSSGYKYSRTGEDIRGRR